MHYDNKFIIENNILEVVIYKHETGTPEIIYDLSSIQQCKLINPSELKRFINLFKTNSNQEKIEKSFPELIELKTEEYWLVSFKANEYCEVKLFTIQQANWKENPEFGLH